ncbi:hypothetical protein K9N68_18750 [Kovacikia minuta CCNUW1]|uniref:LysR substrate-binding domain-containing protein n=1 Tax=Kovacikia minuta TaxID=2931930 RepID=UPI001CCD6262|nr:LysR substrate-binding domain-containing protein [Kovacikia minuta]UBF23796.1 hypothetical protein K9N68_18750 [Kovacikia minuta CCNUW1]
MTDQTAPPSPTDNWSFLDKSRRQRLEKSWAGTFRTHLLEQLPTTDLAQLFPTQGGRPRKDYQLVLGVLVLQQLHDLTDARKTLHQAEHAILLAQQTGRGEIGKFTVGFTGPALNTVLPIIVRRFKEKHPQIELGLERLQTTEQVEALRSQQIQAGLLHPPINDDSLKLEGNRSRG